MASSSSSPIHGRHRVWFEYKGHLDCVKGSFEFIADVKQSIHKKLGNTLSSTSLDLELYLPHTVVNMDDRTATTNLRELRSDMPCSSCYGVNLLCPLLNSDGTTTSSPSPSSATPPPHIVVMSVSLAMPETMHQHQQHQMEVMSYQQQQQQQRHATPPRPASVLSGGFGGGPGIGSSSSSHQQHQQQQQQQQQQRPDSALDFATIGVVDDEDDAAPGGAGGGAGDDAVIETMFASSFQQQQHHQRGGGGGGGGVAGTATRPSSSSSGTGVHRQILDNRPSSSQPENPRNTRLMKQNSQTAASADNIIRQQQQQQRQRTSSSGGVVCVGIDVVTAVDTKTIIGTVTMELPIADVKAAAPPPAATSSFSSGAAADASTSQQSGRGGGGLFFNRYVLERCRDAMTKNVALSASRSASARLSRVMLYDTDFGEYVLFSDATNPSSFPIFTSGGGGGGGGSSKLVGRPSLLAVVDFPPSTPADVAAAGFVVTAPLYIALPLSAAPAGDDSVITRGRSATTSSSPASAPQHNDGYYASSSPSTPYINTRPSSKVAFQPPTIVAPPSAMRLDRPHSAISSAAVGRSQQQQSLQQQQHQQQGSSSSSSSMRRPWSAGAPPVVHSYTNGQQQQQHHYDPPTTATPKTTTTTTMTQHQKSYADNRDQQKTADAIVRKVSPPPPPPLASPAAATPSRAITSSPSTAASAQQQKEQIEALVNRLTKVSQQSRDEAERCKQLEEVLAERQLKHEEQLNDVRREAEAKFQEEHEVRMKELNAQLDGQVQELRQEIWTLKQRNKIGVDGLSVDEVSELRRKVARYEAEIDTLNKKHNNLEVHLENAVQRYDEIKEEKKTLGEKLDKTRKEKFEVKQELEAQMEANGALRDLTVLQLRVEELEQSCHILQRDRTSLHKKLSQKTDDFILMERRAEDAERELNQFRDQWSEENLAKTKRIADLTQKLENALAQQSSSVSTAGAAVKSADAAKHEVDTVRTQLLELTLQLEAEKKRCEELLQQQMEHQIEDSFRSKALDLTRQNLSLMQERDSLKQKLWETEHNLREAKTQNQTAQARRQAEELHTQAASSTSRVLLEENAELQEKLSAALDTGHAAEKTIAALKAEVDHLRATASPSSSPSSSTDNSYNNLQQQQHNNTNRKTIKVLQERVGNLERDNDDLRKMLEEKNKQILVSSMTGNDASSSSSSPSSPASSSAKDSQSLSLLEAREKDFLDHLAKQKEHFIDDKEKEIARLNAEWQRKLDDAVERAAQQMLFEHQQSSQSMFSDDAEKKTKKMDVLLKFSKALRQTSRQEVKSLEVEKHHLKEEHKKEVGVLQDDVAGAQRETFCKEETVRRERVEKEALVELTNLQKVFEDEVLQHIAALGMQDTFTLDDPDSFYIAPAPPAQSAAGPPPVTTVTTTTTSTSSPAHAFRADSNDSFTLSDASMYSSKASVLGSDSTSSSPPKSIGDGASPSKDERSKMLASFKLGDISKTAAPAAGSQASTQKPSMKASDTMNWSTFTIDDDPTKSMMMGKSARSMRARHVGFVDGDGHDGAEGGGASSPSPDNSGSSSSPLSFSSKTKPSPSAGGGGAAPAAVAGKQAPAAKLQQEETFFNSSFGETVSSSTASPTALQRAAAEAARAEAEREQQQTSNDKKKTVPSATTTTTTTTSAAPAAAASTSSPSTATPAGLSSPSPGLKLDMITSKASFEQSDADATTTTTAAAAPKPSDADNFMANEDEISDFEFDEDF